MTSVDFRHTVRTLSEIAHTFESPEGAPDRVQRALELLGELIPSQRVAILQSFPGMPQVLLAVPEPLGADRDSLLSTLDRLLGLVRHAVEIEPTPVGLPHLTLPLIGMDEVIGLVRLEASDGVVYDEEDLRLLSVVAAQLSAYLAMIKMRTAEARQTKELAAAHDFQQLLVAVVSHDLRSPLGVITLAARALLATADPRQAQTIERVLRSSQKAERLISDLLDVTQARAVGHISVARKAMDLGAVLRDVVEEARLSHAGRDIELVAPDRLTGEWDPERLSQAISNLIDNAIKYGEAGSAARVEVRADVHEVVVEVHNDGPPIPAELLPILFEPYKQGKNVPRRVAGAGLGLGLYIVEQIVRSHGGKVAARSTAAAGTTVTVTLPRWSGAAEASTRDQVQP